MIMKYLVQSNDCQISKHNIIVITTAFIKIVEELVVGLSNPGKFQ